MNRYLFLSPRGDASNVLRFGITTASNTAEQQLSYAYTFPLMLRYVVALALGFSVIALANVATSNAADEKKDTKAKTLEGKLVCTKCKLSETDACGNALQVKDGDKVVTYYLKDKGKGEKYHKCSGEADAKVTGVVVEEGGKKYIKDAKVEKK